MVEELIDRFAAQAPAALMFRSLFARIYSDERLDSIFAEHRERQVEGDLLFSSLIQMLVPVVSCQRASVNASYKASGLDVSRQAVYDKLRGVEAAVSAALLRTPVSELRAIQDQAKTTGDDLLPGYHTYVIDGKKYNGTEHRLKETRTMTAAPLPGIAIAMFDTRYQLFIDVENECDAYRCERKVFEPMLERLEEGSLYLADRNFSDGPLLHGFINARAFFVIRQHGASPGWRKIPGEKRKSKGKDSNGAEVYEQLVEVQLPNNSWHKLRRISVFLKTPTRKGDKVLHILSNLPQSVSTVKIANLYRKRWTIETCLGYLAQALNAEINTLCYPPAAGLCFCLALTLFNIMSTIKALIESHSASSSKKNNSPIEVSYYYLAHEIAEHQAGLQVVIDDDYWDKHASLTIVQYVSFLKKVANNADLKRYRKTTRGPKKPPPKKKPTARRHVATQRILNVRK